VLSENYDSEYPEPRIRRLIHRDHRLRSSPWHTETSGEERPHLPRSGTSAASIMVADRSPTDYQLQLSQTPVKDIAWLHVGQTSPILPSFMLERASSEDSARVAIHVLHARRVRICSSVASSGVPGMVLSRHSKWLQPGVMPQSGFRSRSTAVEVHRVHHVSDI
jgi:hypothetical protein